jgi:hypothetical protein
MKSAKTVKNPFFKKHMFSFLKDFMDCSKVDSIQSKGYCWADSVEKGKRKIYIRCLNCCRIFELGNKMNSRAELLRIDHKKKVGPCLVCPYCFVHVWTRLDGYEPGDVDDIFTANIDKARQHDAKADRL